MFNPAVDSREWNQLTIPGIFWKIKGMELVRRTRPELYFKVLEFLADSIL
jgi:hypothetical protein